MAIINRDVVPIILLLFVATRDINARCCRGRKPEFVLGPIVANVSPTLVSVSWLGSIIPRDCADEFEILYWKTNSEIHSNHKKSSNQKTKLKETKKDEGGRKSKQSSDGSGNCNGDISCLNDILEVLKIDKDMVQNYIQQKKRLDTRLTLAGLMKPNES